MLIMQKRDKNIYVLLAFLGIFVIILGMGFVSAVAEDSIAGTILLKFGNVGDGTISSFFSSDNLFLQKSLIFFLVAFLVFGIVELLPFASKNKNSTWIAWGISFIVSALGILFLDASDIYTILFSYQVLGMTLSIILPFLLLLTASIKLYEKGQYFTAQIMWVLFGAIMLVRLFIAPLSEMGTYGFFTYALFIVGIIVMLRWGRKIAKLIVGQKVLDKYDKFKQEVEAQRVKRQTESGDILGI